MKVKVEASGLTIGVDNSITDALKSGEWGVRLTFCNDDNDGRFEVVFNSKEVPSLITELEKALESIKKLPNMKDGEQ